MAIAEIERSRVTGTKQTSLRQVSGAEVSLFVRTDIRSQATARPSLQTNNKSMPVTRAQIIVCEISRLSPQTGIHFLSPANATI